MSKTLTARQQYWSEHLDNAERSGQSIAEYARINQMPAYQLYQHRHLLKRKATVTSAAPAVHFAEVFRSGVSPSPMLRVQIGSTDLHFDQLPDAQWLRQLLDDASTP